ncbi:MAG TPA: SRPBCC family protein [Propionibacteriaceae bacterium]|nr:SRPBCC family protein [Propionibacteriaceae bacterium]
MTAHDIRRPGTTEHTRAGEQSLHHRREFAAPADLVQRAHTDPDLFRQWMGPRGTTLRLDRFDAVTGGGFRYVVESPNGSGWAFNGVYHRVEPGRIIHTWEYEGEPDATLETLVFTDLPGGRTRLDVTSTYTSKDSCDAMLASGMDAGMDEDFERLDAVLDSL